MAHGPWGGGCKTMHAHAPAGRCCSLPDWQQVDNFIITSGNIGPIQKIKIRSSNSGLGAAWHLNKVARCLRQAQAQACNPVHTGQALAHHPFGKAQLMRQLHAGLLHLPHRRWWFRQEFEARVDKSMFMT